MNEIRKHLDFAIHRKNIDDDGIRIEGFASTDDVDRVGDVIPASAWDLGNYQKNKIILFNHNYDEPIGKAEEIEVRENGLYVKCLIDPMTKAGRQIENDVLKAFSVGFILKDAKYDSNTNTFVLTDVELLEVSVVSVPANAAATFSLEKSCNDKEFASLMKMYGPKVPEEGASPELEETQKMSEKEKEKAPEPQVDIITASMEKMFERFEARMDEKRAAADAAAKLAAEEKAAAKAVEVETGAERLMADMEKRFNDMNADTAKTIDELKTQLKEKADEIAKMNESKRVLPSGGGRSGPVDAETAKELVHAHLFGVITGKGMDTDFAKRVMQKADIDIIRDDAEMMDDTIRSTIEREIEMNLRAAALFRRITVTSGSTTLPIAGDVEPARFQTGPANGPEGSGGNKGTSGGNLQGRDGSVSDTGNANQYTVKEKVLRAHRLISQTYISNDTEEQIILNLMPLITDRVVRSHARAMEDMVLLGYPNTLAGVGTPRTIDGLINGRLDTNCYTSTRKISSGSDGAALEASMLLSARKRMGIYGLDPSAVTYIVPINGFYNLIEDKEFTDMDKVGPMASKIQGMIGMIYGSPVITTDAFVSSDVASEVEIQDCIGIAVNPMNYVIPQLRNLTLESDYEVGEQRRVIVAYQSTGFEDMVEGATSSARVVNAN